MYEIYQQKYIDKNNKVYHFYLRKDSTDHDTVNSIICHEEYHFADIELKDNDTIIDIGAHIGGATAYFQKHDKKLNIFSFEPLPENFELLKRNISVNYKNKVTACQNAIGGKNGKLDIWYAGTRNEDEIKHNFIGNCRHLRDTEHFEADMFDLKTIFRVYDIKHCRILKIDAEESEYPILKYCPPEILDKIDYIIGEHHYNTRQKLFEYTKGLFIDDDCEGKTMATLGQFKFTNKKERQQNEHIL